MADRWFRVPTTTVTKTEGEQQHESDGPKYRDLDGITGFSGNTIGNSPQWVVRFYGDTATLDEIAAESDAKELTAEEAARRFGNATGQSDIPDDNWDVENLKTRFKVEV